jgi:hypothetical protein
MGALWPDDLCKHCPHSDMCDLNDPCEAPPFTECPRVQDWRDSMELRAELAREREWGI